MIKYDLSGNWELYPVNSEEPEITTPDQLKGRKPICGTVPGNLELDLTAAGLTKDPFVGENGRAYREYEFYDFWYQREFTAPEGMTGKCELVFDAVDCFAEYFLNGKKIGESANAFLPFRFPVDVQEKNVLSVRVISAVIATRKYPEEAAATGHLEQVYDTIYARKPGHYCGWDISPRLQLGGIWKGVRLEKKESDFNFIDFWMDTKSLDKERDTALMIVYFHFEAGRHSLRDYMLKFTGTCGDHTFVEEYPAYFTYGKFRFEIQNPQLWFPAGYGKQNLYEVEAELRNAEGVVVARMKRTLGIRTVALDMTPTNKDNKGHFDFYVNGVRVRAHGSNHIPMDAMHSRDVQRMTQVLDLFRDANCNMMRIWGGGVYEADEFYDYCDRNGIMVWHDFMIGGNCNFPQNKTFLDIMLPEAEYEVRRLRHHASLVVWCGDNECDQHYMEAKIPLKWNRLNRELLPDVVHRLDPLRPYVPSSPYVSPEAEESVFSGNLSMQPERHLWGPRETFKLPFYGQSGAKFISETGWHGCPNVSSLKKFLTPPHFIFDEKDVEWDYHASNPFTWKGGPMGYRSVLNGKQLREYFHTYPQTLEEYARYTQIHQAEAKKYTVECARLDSTCGGILWWNIIDCWPQFSDAVVDYYFGKKLAYYYLTRSQQPFCIICSEPCWNSRITAVNDTNVTAKGTYEVETEKGIELSGSFEVAPGEQKVLGSLRSPRATNELWLLRWECNGVKGTNHYISGNIQMDYDWYMERLPKIAALDNAFDADKFAL